MPVDEANRLAASNELLMRQVHPNMMHEGRLSSSAFTPTEKDQGKLSADREQLISPKEAYERYLTAKKLKAAGGTWGVSLAEFQSLNLAAYSDAIDGNHAHVLVDFTIHPTQVHRALGKLAYKKANDRGRLFPDSA